MPPPIPPTHPPTLFPSLETKPRWSVSYTS